MAIEPQAETNGAPAWMHNGSAARNGELKLAGGRLSEAITRAVVCRYREYIGRGPTKAHAIQRGNTVAVILGDTMTKAERTLADAGQYDLVKKVRDALGETMHEPLRAAIEELTGCAVRTRMSAHNEDPDMSVEVFVLDRALPDDAG